MAELSDNIVKKMKKIVKEEKRLSSEVQINPDYETWVGSLKGLKKEEFDNLKEAALAGDDPQTMLRLAICYERGIQTPIDYPKAISLFEKTAAKGCALSLNVLGEYYVQRGGYAKALPLFTESAGKGNIEACCNLGILLIQGHGVSQDEESLNKCKGFEYIKSAADTGCGEALNSLGTCYALQQGIPEVDRPVYLLRAIDCYLKALEAGSKHAKESLLNILKKHNRYQEEEVDDHLNWDLCRAARNNDLKKLMKHISAGAKVNASREEGWTALHFACKRGNKSNNFDCAKFLIFKMANIHKKNQAGDEPIDFIKNINIKKQMIELSKFSKKARICLHIKEVEKIFDGEVFFNEYPSKDFNKVIKLIDLGLKKMRKKKIEKHITDACDFLKKWLLILKSHPDTVMIPKDQVIMDDFGAKFRIMKSIGPSESVPFTIKNFSLYVLDCFIIPELLGREIHTRACESLEQDKFREVLNVLEQGLPPKWANHFKWRIIGALIGSESSTPEDTTMLITEPPLKIKKEAERLVEKLNIIEPFKGLVIPIKVKHGYAVGVRNLHIARGRIEGAKYRQHLLDMGSKGLLTLCKDFLVSQDTQKLALVNRRNYGLLSESLGAKKKSSPS